MGIKCPICQTHASYIHAITATGEPAKTNSDIIARKLSCGHTIGSKEYMKFQEELKTVDNDEAEAIRKIRETSTARKTEIWQNIVIAAKVN